MGKKASRKPCSQCGRPYCRTCPATNESPEYGSRARGSRKKDSSRGRGSSPTYDPSLHPRQSVESLGRIFDCCCSVHKMLNFKLNYAKSHKDSAAQKFVCTHHGAKKAESAAEALLEFRQEHKYPYDLEFISAIEPGEEEIGRFMISLPAERALEWKQDGDILDSYRRAVAIGPILFSRAATTPIPVTEAIALRDECMEEYGMAPLQPMPHLGDEFEAYRTRFSTLLQGAQAFVVLRQIELCRELNKPCVVQLPADLPVGEEQRVLDAFANFEPPVLLSAYQGRAEFVLELRKKVAERVAKIKDLTREEIIEQTYKNAIAFFGDDS